MLGMNRVDDNLASRKNDVSRCQKRHSDLLRSLFETTSSTLDLNHVKRPHHDLASFLEINNISLGRSFDPSTLSSTTQLLNALQIDSYEAHGEPTNGSDATLGDGSRLSKVGRLATRNPGERDGEPGPASAHLPNDNALQWSTNGSTISTPATERLAGTQEQNLKVVKQLGPSVDAKESPTHPDANQERVSSPSKALPSSTNDAGSMAPVQLEELNAEQMPGKARPVHLPPKQVQKERSERPGQVTDDGEDQGAWSRDSALTPRTDEEGVERRSSVQEGQAGNRGRRPDATLKSQSAIAKAKAFGGAASTPDEQLRLEEAQSMQLSKANAEFSAVEDNASRPMQPPASLSSDFIHDSMVDGGFGADMPGVDDRATATQDDPTQDSQGRQDHTLAQPKSGLRDHMFSGMNGDASRDLTFSRRPPMRIDTGIPSTSDSIPIAGNRQTAAIMSTPSEMAAPRKSAPIVGRAQSPPERMTTRVSSGAIRHKSVSEILGETPKATPTQADKSPFARESGDVRREDSRSLQTPKSISSCTTPDPVAFKRRLSELKEKERSKLSAVVFASSHNEDNESPKEDRDYLLTLFNYQVTSPLRPHTLNTLVKGSHKTLTTSDHYVDFNERQACRLLNRIYELQSKNCWALRQIERSPEPARAVTHWDVVLSEAKWLRIDFREERKFKMAAARFAANACAAWVAGTSKQRKSLQVKLRTQPARGNSISGPVYTPDLVHSADDEVSDETDDDSIPDPGNAPAAIFSLPPDMFVFGLNQSPVAEKLLLELPLYQPNADVHDAALGITHIEPDAGWKKPLVPVSKFAQGKIVPISKSSHSRETSFEVGPPCKRSRFNYHEADLCSLKPSGLSNLVAEKALDPEQNDVALFDPENKHIRDRIHTGHAFRPPSEYIMPSQQFFESRQSSQWTQAEDDELRRTVKEYSYNWSLISCSMTLPSMFTSGAERRTPWECFERWISLEGLPVEMAKINYFKAYTSRLQLAQRTVEANQLAQQQQQGGNAAQLPMRRRNTQPYSVERRKDARHLHIIDAMRKLAKKRETALSKQQHVASLAAMRKAQEPAKPRTGMHTPQEFSRIKYDRQLKIEEQARQYRASVIQHQKATQAAKANQQAGQQINGVLQNRNPLPGVQNGTSPNMTTANPHGQIRGGGGDPSRPVQQMQRIANGQSNGVLPANSHSVPHAPMQPNVQMQMQMQQRMGPGMAPDRNTIMQDVARVQAQQQVYQQQMRQQGLPQPNGHAGSPHMQTPNLVSQSNAAMLASVPGRSSPSINGLPTPQDTSTSPRMSQPQALSSGMTPAVNQISSQFKARHPQASPEQIIRMTTEQLYKMSTEARHQAMAAAAGNANMNAVASNSNIGLAAPSPLQQAAMLANGGGNAMNPQHYAQMMRTQQAGQQRGASSGNGQNMNGNGINGNARNPSRSVTPLIQRTASAQGGPRPSQSPSARPMGLASGQ